MSAQLVLSDIIENKTIILFTNWASNIGHFVLFQQAPLPRPGKSGAQSDTKVNYHYLVTKGINQTIAKMTVSALNPLKIFIYEFLQLLGV